MYNKGKLWNFITYLHSQERELDLSITYENILCLYFHSPLKRLYTQLRRSLNEVLYCTIILYASNCFFQNWTFLNVTKHILINSKSLLLRYFNSQMWQIQLSIKHKTELHVLATLSSPCRSMLRWDWYKRILKIFWQDLTYSGPGTTGKARRKTCFFSAKPKY